MENACFYKVFLSMNYNKVSAPSLLFSYSNYYKMRPEIDLLQEGALRALPSKIPTLFNGIEWAV
jgi:hypothetical protein